MNRRFILKCILCYSIIPTSYLPELMYLKIDKKLYIRQLIFKRLMQIQLLECSNDFLISSLNALPNRINLEELVEKISNDLEKIWVESDAVSETDLITKLIDKNYKEGNIVILNEWLVSLTEVRIIAAFYLYKTSKNINFETAINY